MSKNISVIVPCYRSEKSLDELVNRLSDTLKDDLLEIILINDSSPDNTWKKITELAQTYSFVRGINLMRNFGQHSAIFCGFNHTSGDYVITIDDDLQNPPEEIIRMIEELEKDISLDIVLGVPKEPKKSFIKKIGSSYLNHLTSKILDKPKDLKMSSFRAIRKGLVDELKTNETTNPAIGSILFKIY
jgi:glycosyltransferase involved in cell wall biosynthesis